MGGHSSMVEHEVSSNPCRRNFEVSSYGHRRFHAGCLRHEVLRAEIDKQSALTLKLQQL
jgi:hypothetical protein